MSASVSRGGIVRPCLPVCLCVWCARVYLLVDGDFEQLVILERLGAEHQTVVVLGEVARGGAIVVAEGDTVAASPMEHVEPRSRRVASRLRHPTNPSPAVGRRT